MNPRKPKVSLMPGLSEVRVTVTALTYALGALQSSGCSVNTPQLVLHGAQVLNFSTSRSVAGTESAVYGTASAKPAIGYFLTVLSKTPPIY